MVVRELASTPEEWRRLSWSVLHTLPSLTRVPLSNPKFGSLALLYWIGLLLAYLSDLAKIDPLPAHAEEVAPVYGYIINAVTLGIVRPVLVQAGELIFLHYPWKEEAPYAVDHKGYSDWLDLYFPGVPQGHLWFLSFVIIATLLYP